MNCGLPYRRAPNGAVPLWLILVVSLAVPGACAQQERPVLVNFGHLDHLTEDVALGGHQVSIVHVYSSYPDYAWVDAKESGPEGIACVDDAARAAVCRLRDFELTGRLQSLERAKGYLEFVLAMQAPDGQFYNFILRDRSINREGKTSLKSFGWWAARAVWSMAHGSRVFRDQDSAFARRLDRALRRTLPHAYALIGRFGAEEQEDGFRIPVWLLHDSAADATSELLLGLAEQYRVEPSRELAELMRKLAAGLMLMQEGDPSTFPYGLHRSWRTMYHMWGNGQTQALATVGLLLGDSSMIASARREALGWYARLLCAGFVHSLDVRDPGSGREFEQIAYSVRPMAVGLIRLFEATKDTLFLKLAGLSASWLLGNNPAGIPMYDSSTGRCYDGIQSGGVVNRNAGAESTIEALLTLIELERYPEAAKLARYRRQSASSSPEPRAVFTGPDGSEMSLLIDAKGGPVVSYVGRN